MTTHMNATEKGLTDALSTPETASDTHSTVHIRQVTSAHDFDALEMPWRALFEETSNAGIFNSWDWNRLWWEHYGDAHALLILSAHVDGKLVGIAPFYVTTTQALKFKRVQTLRFIGSGGDTSPDDLGVLCAPEHDIVVADAIARHILQAHAVERLSLCDMPANSPLYCALMTRLIDHNWALPTLLHDKRRVDELPPTLDDYVASLSKNARKQRKRRMQKLQRAGQAEFLTCSTPACVEAAFSKLAALHHKRQASKGESGSFSSDAYNGFHLDLMRRALERGELRLVELKLDGETIGIEYAFLIKGVIALFQTGFDPDTQDLSPGHLMMMHMIELGIEGGATRLDTLKGDYEYKATYAKQWRHTVSVEAYRSALLSTAVRMARWCRSGARRGPDDHEAEEAA